MSLVLNDTLLHLDPLVLGISQRDCINITNNPTIMQQQANKTCRVLRTVCIIDSFSTA